MPKKYRGHGEGSIYQRKDGRWEAILDLGFDAQGRRRRLRFYGKTRKEVQEKLMAALEQRRQGTLVLTPAKLTVNALFVLAVTAGLRRGELLGLRWSDVDLERGTIQVRQTIQRVRGQGLVPSETKSQRSRRLVVLPAFAVAALKRHKAQQAQEKLLFGPAYQDNDLVFCKEWGAPLDGWWLSRYTQRILEKAGLPKIRLHHLRHTSATLLLAQGVHPKIVSERLGHSTIHLTLDTYSHVLPNMQKEAAQKLDDLLNTEKWRKQGHR